MGVQIAKKAVPAVAPVAKPAVPPNYAPAAALPATAAAPQAEGADDADDVKEPRKTRKDFESWEGFCDYKVAVAEKNVVKWQERAALWATRKTTKDADVAVKKQKKADKLIAAWIKIQEDMGTDPAAIKEMVAAFKSKLAAQE